MKPFRRFQERYGFTQREIAVLLFFCVTFLVGSAVRWYRQQSALDAPAPLFDYAGIDSEFAARAQMLLADTTAAPAARGTAEVRKKKNPPPAPGSVDLNSASLDKLATLPGIGREIARRIAEYRAENGPFESVDDLLEVKGIGPKKLEKLRPFVSVERLP